MITKITSNSFNISQRDDKKQPQFKGVDGLLNAVTMPIQLCEANPMLNVTVLDLATAIIPRTVVEAETNPYAGLEAFRRESSGLIINCLIPGFIVAGIAKFIGKGMMNKDTKMADCWASKQTVDMVSKYWQDAKGSTQEEKIKDTLRSILTNTEGVNGKDTRYAAAFKEEIEKTVDHITKQILHPEAADNASFIEKFKADRKAKKEFKAVYEELTNKTKFAENIRIEGFKGDSGKALFGQSLKDVLENAPKILKELADGKNINAEEFAKNAKKLVTTKSLLGLGVIIPLAISAQPINRWLTERNSGKKGAPIYKDFAETESKKLSPKEQLALNSQKLVSVASIVGVAALSIMKKPTEMFKSLAEFKGIFPSMDQARLISTATFASRMASSQDKNDLREATFRDIATFSAFYFLGDYVAKGFATAIQKLTKIELINDLSPLKGNEGILEKIKHWTKDTAMKSSVELEKGRPRQMRALCQLGNIGFSLVMLGLLIPKMYRAKTNEEHEKELRLAKAAKTSQAA